MTDVRLTATTPEGDVVPVLSNTKGELLLEAPIAPPEFDGNLDGDLTVTGGGTFAGSVSTDRASGYAAFYTQRDKVLTSIQMSDGDLRIGGEPSDISKANIVLNPDGNASFSGAGDFGYASAAVSDVPALSVATTSTSTVHGAVLARNYNSDGYLFTGLDSGGNQKVLIKADGRATFSGDVVVTSRSKKWTLVEQGGLCHMVEQATATTVAATEYPKLRDVFAELNVIEKALEEVMTKLRMTEPDGWPVWDGSSIS